MPGRPRPPGGPGRPDGRRRAGAPNGPPGRVWAPGGGFVRMADQ
ncbi:hypothetical protein SGM_1572 [Streptomyces griseoaurantiacus M045]|uniref:Uncharacterized protein n=1 Tax=Streptomyces griseoaurantiacus M045 TaxID=996637 RepID=F3NEK8_9ACTN|nr:hypothetical protein SGM_1572 [Streptomyces griseoaurantiacus M045]